MKSSNELAPRGAGKIRVVNMKIANILRRKVSDKNFLSTAGGTVVLILV